MAENLKALRRRVRSIRNTRKITRAMEMVSAAKLRRSQAIMKAGRPYAEKLQQLLGRLAGSAAGEYNDPLFQARPAQHVTLIVFTGDRGLCGGFNTNVTLEAQRLADELGRDKVGIVAIGRKGNDFFRKRGYNVIDSRLGLGGRVDGELTRGVANRQRERFLRGETDRVVLAYNEFLSQTSFRPLIEQYLPLEPWQLLGHSLEAEKLMTGGTSEYLFEPAPERLFASLLPRYLESKLYITLAQTMTAEHSARMLAMNNATKNCGELIDSLTLKMNKARQAAITKEILEVVGGAEALKG